MSPFVALSQGVSREIRLFGLSVAAASAARGDRSQGYSRLVDISQSRAALGESCLSTLSLAYA